MFKIRKMPAISLWILMLFLFMAPLVGLGAQAQDWKEEFYNPQPLADDLTLPMPCGGAMAFRPVEIPSKSALDDRRFELGHSDQDYGYIEGRRFAYIAGAFTNREDANKRLYYLSKYEITRDQYAAVMNSQCPNPSHQGRLPAVDLSWFDGVDFSRRYTEWLMQHAQETLKSAGPEPAFLRLPTEEEWEFAARGGLQVDKAEFVGSVFPMPTGNLWEYVWYNSSKSSAKGQPQPIGSLKPNPLGLYDILGNVAEMVFTPFHLDHRGRLHGQAGGFVARGCDAKAQESEIRTSWRQEYSFFNATTKEANINDSLGVRLVLTAPVIVSHKRLKEIRKDWSVLPVLTGEAGERADSAIKELNAMASEVKDKEYKQKLEAIQGELEEAHSEINEARNRTLRALIRMGAFLGKRVVTIDNQLHSMKTLKNTVEAEFKKRVKAVKDAAAGEFEQYTSEEKERLREKHNQELDSYLNEIKSEHTKRMEYYLGEIRATEDLLDNTLSYYSDTVINVAGDFSDPEIKDQLEVVRVEFEKSKNDYLIDYGAKFGNHISEWRNQGKADKSAWLHDLTKGVPK